MPTLPQGRGLHIDDYTSILQALTLVLNRISIDSSYQRYNVIGTHCRSDTILINLC